MTLIRHVFAVFILFASFDSLVSQESKATHSDSLKVITLQLLDSSSNRAVSEAYVVLNCKTGKNEQFESGVSDENGEVIFNDIVSDSSICTIDVFQIGFKPIESRVVNIRSSRKKIWMIPQNVVLDEIVILLMPVDSIEYSKDSIKLDFQRFVSPTDQNIYDVLNKFPDVEIIDGKMFIDGQPLQEVKINGKTYLRNGSEEALSVLQADFAKELQIIDVSSGPNSTETVKVINIISEEDNVITGLLSGGYGTSNRYQIEGSRFVEKERFNYTLTVNSNNINEESYLSAYADNLQNGINDFHAVAGNLDYDINSKNKFHLDYSYNFIDRNKEQIKNERNIDGQAPNILYQSDQTLTEQLPEVNLGMTHIFDNGGFYTINIGSVNKLKRANENLANEMVWEENTMFKGELTGDDDLRQIGFEVNAAGTFFLDSTKRSFSETIISYENSFLDEQQNWFNYNEVPQELFLNQNLDLSSWTQKGKADSRLKKMYRGQIFQVGVIQTMTKFKRELFNLQENVTINTNEDDFASVSSANFNYYHSQVVVGWEKRSHLEKYGLEIRGGVIGVDVFDKLSEISSSIYTPTFLPILFYQKKHNPKKFFRLNFQASENIPNPNQFVNDLAFPVFSTVYRGDLSNDISFSYKLNLKWFGITSGKIQTNLDLSTEFIDSYIANEISILKSDSVLGVHNVKEGTMILTQKNLGEFFLSSLLIKHGVSFNGNSVGLKYGVRFNSTPTWTESVKSVTSLTSGKLAAFGNFELLKNVRVALSGNSTYSRIISEINPLGSYFLNWNLKYSLMIKFSHGWFFEAEKLDFQSLDYGSDTYGPIIQLFGCRIIKKVPSHENFQLAIEAFDLLNKNAEYTFTPLQNYLVEERKLAMSRYVLLKLSYVF